MVRISPSPTFLDWAHQTPSNKSIRKSISSSSLSSGAKSGRSSAQWDTETSFVRGGSYTLQDTAALDTIESLLLQYGTASHMGARDWSYSFYINGSQTGALIYKVLDKVAMISGDPLCPPDQYLSFIREFQAHCKKQHLGVAMVAASDNMSKIAHQHKWMSIHFGTEKVLNPCTNPMLLGRSGNRTVAKCRQLVKQGTTVDIYCPAEQYDAAIEKELVRIYKDWRAARNAESGATNAFMTVYDILSLPRLMAFVYSKDASGNINGFAALRKLGQGYHVDPFIAAADAPKGTSDLLLYATMALAKETGITKLSLGFEVVPELEDMERVPKVLHGVIKKTHRRIFGQLHLGGKKTFFDRFHPDEQQDAGLWILYPQRPSLKHMLATMHFANIRVRTVIS
ncbi:hypothetical protein M409DRAFT_36546 [Zasmidium cellare ATCC 36951]|uniref:Phosphatidylglycerol lysyltransferase C-terminal domain-containing protein n=1 Tax=Zasmidium cellare ATCC 36951 TaxID=1080233 RepID=A0A6A6CP82_ZASCE|nr:uncharacterized protein M409DRAFT_36546 [Zasmidium cellare ATCC 36951]KAF2167559.1 hypothetical protein M409DRAFT_36546 [Zasmidium cellare ATCC 36951]